MADEVRMLDNDKAILLIRGEKPVVDLKYDILKHPNIKFTADGNGSLYEYGKVDKRAGTITPLSFEELQEIKDIKNTEEIEIESSLELLSEEDIENYIYMEEFENERKQKNDEQE